MKIYVDADACPNPIKDILVKAAQRTQTVTLFVANKWLAMPDYHFIKMKVVTQGADKADDYIAEHVEVNDLVITADIPLADHVVDKGATALNPRGTLYTKNNIKSILSARDFQTELRSAGVATSGPKELSARDIQDFANALDRYLTKFAR